MTATTTSPAIDVHQLRKVYREGLVVRHSLEALKGVSFTIARGEIFGLLGPNGAGKTTFVKVLLGIVRKSGGTATLLGLPAGSCASRRKIGYLPENLRIPRHLNARSALALYGQLSGMSLKAIRTRGNDLLEQVGLADRAGDSVKKYSKGMLQRLGLAIALLHDPELIFMDEPTDGLDPVGRAQIRHLMQRLKEQGKTIFLNSHLLQEVELICDRVAILDRGVVRGIGTVEELVPQDVAGIKLTLHLLGTRTAVEEVLGNYASTLLRPLGPDEFEVQLRLPDQHDVDACIDRLRKHGVSIRSLIPQRLSLEDAFLEILNLTQESA